MNNYNYNCKDHSLLLPYLNKYIFRIIHKIVPYQLPANLLTIFSIIIMNLVFIYYIFFETSNKYSTLFATFCIITYVILDHLDGLQAKITKTSSALGEFLDHYSDVYNSAIIIYLLFTTLKINLDFYFFLILWFNFVAFAIVYVEQRETNQLIFEKFGSLEGVIIVIVIMTLCLSERFLNFWSSVFIFSQPNYIILVIGFILGSLSTSARSLLRIGKIPIDFILFLILGSSITIFCTLSTFSWYLSFIIITLYSSYYILRSMCCHLIGYTKKYPDLLIILVYLFIYLLYYSGINNIEISIIIWCYSLILFIKILVSVINIFYHLRSKWVWINK